MKATITWTCCWCLRSSRRSECQIPFAQPRSWTRKSHVRLQNNRIKEKPRNVLRTCCLQKPGREQRTDLVCRAHCAALSRQHTHSCTRRGRQRRRGPPGGREDAPPCWGASTIPDTVQRWRTDTWWKHRIQEHKVGFFLHDCRLLVNRFRFHSIYTQHIIYSQVL